MKLSIIIPYMDQLHDSKGAMGLLKYTTNPETEWVVIDNGSKEPVERFFLDVIKPKRFNYIRNEENIGMIKTQQQGYENSSGDVLAYLHNDVFMYEKDWDKRLLEVFEDNPKIGGVGLFGAQGCGPIGERIQDVPYPGAMAGFSNMLEAEVHGFRMEEEIRATAIFDGLFMAFRKEMLDKAGGFDQNYVYHHLYDRDASLTSLAMGYDNVTINIPCHHWGGMTANRSGYQNFINSKLPEHKDYIRPGETNPVGADMWTHDENTKKFAEKWKDVLPLYVETDFSFRQGTHSGWDFKGDKIRGVK